MQRHARTILVVVPALLLATSVLATPATAAVPRCFGEKATIVGTSADDVLNGSSRRDVIAGRGGDDVIKGHGRADLICAGKGDDVVRGGDGVDLMFGQGGNDEIFGQAGFFNQAVPGSGNDFVNGGPSPGDEVIYLDAGGPIVGDLGADTVTGHGNDEVVNTEWLIGTDFDDTLTGTDESDALFGAGGDDTLNALGGEVDFLAGGDGDDAIDGGSGFDFLGNFFFPDNYLDQPPAGPITIDLPAGTLTGAGTDALLGIEGGQGSTGNDVMIGDAQDNEFTALLGGSDTVDAGAGDDLVDGGDGVDDLDGGPGDDLLGNLDASAGKTIDLSTQTDSDGDTLAGFENVWGTIFDDVLTGTDDTNEIAGIDGDDDLFGLAGNDVLFGDFFDFTEGGIDTADGGAGTDECDAETEVACEADPPPPATVFAYGQAVRAKVGYATLGLIW